jgi:hypothetical protein
MSTKKLLVEKPKRKYTKQKVRTVAFELITPQRATELLSLNTQNRKICHSTVNRIAQSMVNGSFVTTNVGVGIDTNNVLTDGQQRLSAIVKSNVPVEMIVARNLDPKARLVVDTGRKRSHANSLQMMNLGLKEAKGKKRDYSKLLASVSAYIILHQTNRFNNIQAFGNIITNDEIVDFVQKNEDELMESVLYVTGLSKNCKYAQDTHLFFVYQMHKFFNKRRITQFINIVCGNEVAQNPTTCPATKLRDVLQENAMKKFGLKFKTKDLLGLMIDASNKFMKNVEMKPRKKLVGRPNGSNLINVQFSGDLNEKALNFFNTVTHDTKIIA